MASSLGISPNIFVALLCLQVLMEYGHDMTRRARGDETIAIHEQLLCIFSLYIHILVVSYLIYKNYSIELCLHLKCSLDSIFSLSREISRDFVHENFGDENIFSIGVSVIPYGFDISKYSLWVMIILSIVHSFKSNSFSGWYANFFLLTWTIICSQYLMAFIWSVHTCFEQVIAICNLYSVNCYHRILLYSYLNISHHCLNSSTMK